MSTRGIVIPPPYKVGHDGHISNSRAIDPQYLRMCTLYWDIIDCPNGIIGDIPLGSDDDIDLLQKEGRLIRTTGHFIKRDGTDWKISFYGEHPSAFAFVSQLACLILHSHGGLHWSMGQPNLQLIIPQEDTVSDYVFISPGVKPVNAVMATSTVMSEQTPSSSGFIKGNAIEIELYQAVPLPLPACLWKMCWNSN